MRLHLNAVDLFVVLRFMNTPVEIVMHNRACHAIHMCEHMCVCVCVGGKCGIKC